MKRCIFLMLGTLAIVGLPYRRAPTNDLGIKAIGNASAQFAETIKTELPVFAAAAKVAQIGAQ